MRSMSSGPMTARPSGLFMSEASLARYLFGARPTDAVRCRSDLTRCLSRRATTPRGPSWPTRTGFPRRAGLSSCSTEAKKASMSRWRMVRSQGTNEIILVPRERVGRSRLPVRSCAVRAYSCRSLSCHELSDPAGGLHRPGAERAGSRRHRGQRSMCATQQRQVGGVCTGCRRSPPFALVKLSVGAAVPARASIWTVPRPVVSGTTTSQTPSAGLLTSMTRWRSSLRSVTGAMPGVLAMSASLSSAPAGVRNWIPVPGEALSHRAVNSAHGVPAATLNRLACETAAAASRGVRLGRAADNERATLIARKELSGRSGQLK